MNEYNLRILSAYLKTLPENYQHFDMSTYYRSHSYDVAEYPRQEHAESDTTTCGTVACAIGHGPAAGIPRHASDEPWWKYAERVFSVDETADRWLFDCAWSSLDDTPLGAALRIDWVLDGNDPVNNVDDDDGEQDAQYIKWKEEQLSKV